MPEGFPPPGRPPPGIPAHQPLWGPDIPALLRAARGSGRVALEAQRASVTPYLKGGDLNERSSWATLLALMC